MRTFGVEEELLLVDAATLTPLPVSGRTVALHKQRAQTEHKMALEFKQEQIEIVSPPQTTLADQLEAIRAGRALADAAAARLGARVIALPTVPELLTPHLVPDPRFRRISEQFGLTAVEQLTCGFHVHVAVESREEGVAVLDRIRVWLPVLLALSANSPFWRGVDTAFSSYRYQAWNRWPTTGPTDVFGSAEAYDRYQAALLSTQVPMDTGMLYFDARVSEHLPTVEIRVADVCLEAEHAAVLATITRALVETSARNWRSGVPAPGTPTPVLRTWSWQASRHGVGTGLIDPVTGAPAPAGEVVGHLLESLRPVFIEYGEEAAVEAAVADMLGEGSGARRQREAYSARHDLRDVVTLALEATHHDGPAEPVQAD
ncbi:glutamate--cysteine ligase [Corynebacterium halotolerans]|uniref:Putative glutamate--cysteine ligase 2 n=1 Tax=Corynebacterium halotolerans YIM 70093 = DSM 44683 TaxID=1121362 RepID=M1P330_9CORY|nr:glutamate--cysteine ligase [Corynebacterium halotolerans]AGF71086.1 carboxylate-amine ligase [Corynebacterium halotolerans YIM 70093 = DSM 44683]